MGNNDAKEMLAVCKKEAVKIEAELKHLREVAELHEIATENAARYAAVIEKAKATLDEYVDDDEYRECAPEDRWRLYRDLDYLLATVDMSILRERDAEKWDEGAESVASVLDVTHGVPNPYREAETDGQGGDD